MEEKDRIHRLQADGKGPEWKHFVDAACHRSTPWLRSRGLSREEAEDVIEATLITFQAKLETLVLQPDSSLEDFYFGVLKKKLARHFQHRQRQGRLHTALAAEPETGANSDPPPLHGVDGLLRPRVEALYRLGKIRERTQNVFLRYVCDGIPPAMVAAEFNLRPNAVYRIKNRVIAALRHYLPSLGPSGESPRD